MVPCIVDDSGRPVPDVRGPGFRPPPWIALPSCLADALADRAAGVLDEFPFRATAALHFSNGVVYRATDRRTGSTVLLKEARPWAGLDEQGRDAVARLRQEHWALRQLAGLPSIPRLVDHRIGHEHHFLAREFVDGEPLLGLVHRRNPLLGRRAGGPAARERYARLALAALGRVEDALAQMHERGVVFGDLHPNNVLVRADGSVAFIDPGDQQRGDGPAGAGDRRPRLPGPAGLRGTEVDHYALGCLRLAMFLPLTVLLSWGPGKVDELLDEIAREFPVGPDFADRVRHDLTGRRGSRTIRPEPRPNDTGWTPTDPTDWPARRRHLVDSLVNVATPRRADRLFPGDVQQFLSPAGGLDLASGAAGVLWTLAELGEAIPDLADWLDRAVACRQSRRPGRRPAPRRIRRSRRDRAGHAACRPSGPGPRAPRPRAADRHR